MPGTVRAVDPQGLLAADVYLPQNEAAAQAGKHVLGSDSKGEKLLRFCVSFRSAPVFAASPVLPEARLVQTTVLRTGKSRHRTESRKKPFLLLDVFVQSPQRLPVPVERFTGHGPVRLPGLGRTELAAAPRWRCRQQGSSSPSPAATCRPAPGDSRWLSALA